MSKSLDKIVLKEVAKVAFESADDSALTKI